jgi:WD40 repeat protein
MRGFRSVSLIALLLGAPVAAAQEKARLDALGDPLPAGAVARLGTTRFRPGGRISQLAFSPNGDRLACWSEIGLSVYDAASGRELRHVGLAAARVMTLAWLKDGRGLAVLQLGDQSFYVWEFTDPKAEPPRLPWPTQRTINMTLDYERFDHFAISPDGQHLAAGRTGRLNKERAIDLLELVPGKRVHELKVVRTFGPQPGDCVGLAFAPGGRSLVVFSHERGGREERLVVYDPATGAPCKQMAVPARSARADPDRPIDNLPFRFAHNSPFALAADGRTLARAGPGEAALLWDLQTGKALRPVARHVKPADGKKSAAKGVLDVVIAEGGRALITWGVDSRLRAWDVDTGRPMREFGRDFGIILALAASPDGKRVAAGGINAQVHVWDATTGEEVCSASDFPDAHGAATLSPDGRTAAVAGSDGTIHLWEAVTGRRRRRVGQVTGWARHLSFTPDSKALLVHDGKAKLHLLDVTTGGPLPLPGELGAENVWWLGLSADGRTLLTAREGAVTLWDWPAGRKRHRFGEPAAATSSGAARLSPDGRLLVTTRSQLTDRSGDLEWWDVQTGRRLRQVHVDQDSPPRPLFTPDGTGLLFYSFGIHSERPGDLSLWDPAGLRKRYDFQTPPLLPTTMALQLGPVIFSPDGRTLAVAIAGQPITLYEVASGSVRRQLAGHRSYIHGLAYLPDGRRLLSTSWDRTGLVWDVSLAAGAEPAGPVSAPSWDALSDRDAKVAYRAMARLAADPEKAVAMLRTRVKPAAFPDDAALDRLVADLDDKAFAVRDRAAAELDRLGHAVVPGVLARWGKAESLELRRRLEQFLDKHDRGIPPPDALRQRRVLEVLEQIGTPAARAVLGELAKGSPAVRLTQDAAASLRRLERSRP